MKYIWGATRMYLVIFFSTNEKNSDPSEGANQHFEYSDKIIWSSKWEGGLVEGRSLY